MERSFDCSVRIVTHWNGDEQLFTGTGKVELCDGEFEVRYAGDGYEGALSYVDGTLSMTRFDGAPSHEDDTLSMTPFDNVLVCADFCLGEETKLVLCMPDGNGVLPVFTLSREVDVGEGGITCALSYRLGKGEDAELFQLEISIVFSEEK